VYSEGAMTMIRTNVFLISSQRQKLAKRSRQTGAPVAELIRRAIDQFLGDAKTIRREIDELGDAETNQREIAEFLGGELPSVRRKR
jgi:hypothetical protein